MNTKGFLITIGLSGAISVLLGGFGSHLLNGNISNAQLALWDVAITFQMFHTLALLAITFMNRYLKRYYVQMTYYFFVVGVIFFSGPLYLESIAELFGVNLSVARYFTPIGVLLLTVGWIFITVAGFTYKHNKSRTKHLQPDGSYTSSHRNHHKKDNQH